MLLTLTLLFGVLNYSTAASFWFSKSKNEFTEKPPLWSQLEEKGPPAEPPFYVNQPKPSLITNSSHHPTADFKASQMAKPGGFVGFPRYPATALDDQVVQLAKSRKAPQPSVNRVPHLNGRVILFKDEKAREADDPARITLYNVDGPDVGYRPMAGPDVEYRPPAGPTLDLDALRKVLVDRAHVYGGRGFEGYESQRPELGDPGMRAEPNTLTRKMAVATVPEDDLNIIWV